MILAGDIGGTNARLAWFDVKGGRVLAGRSKVYPSGQFTGLHQIVERFIAEHPPGAPILAACFGVAAPVVGRTVSTLNLPWKIDADELAEHIGVDRLRLLNDLESTGYGLSLLGEKDFMILRSGEPRPQAPAAIIAAGTGLGEAGLIRDKDGFRPFPSEGGHEDFAPRNDLETALLAYLRERFEHVSYERVISGPGLHNIYRFLVDTGRCEAPDRLRREIAGDDPAAVIAKYGLKGGPEVCVQALNIFTSIYGAEAGNVVLRYVAAGGLFIAGGIAPKIAAKLKERRFMESFVAKGRMRSFLENVPVKVVLSDEAAVLGAARMAANMVSTGAPPENGSPKYGTP